MRTHRIALQTVARGAARLILSAVVFAGCRHQPVPPAPGATRFQVLAPRVQNPNRARAMLDLEQPREIIADAERILPVAMPVYPRDALQSRHNGAVISVHVVVDRTGRVRSVAPSLVGFSSGGLFANEFYAAVDAAVRQWRFHPAEARIMAPLRHPDGRVEQTVVRREPVEAEFDLAFTFTSTGDVLPGR